MLVMCSLACRLPVNMADTCKGVWSPSLTKEFGMTCMVRRDSVAEDLRCAFMPRVVIDPTSRVPSTLTLYCSRWPPQCCSTVGFPVFQEHETLSSVTHTRKKQTPSLTHLPAGWWSPPLRSCALCCTAFMLALFHQETMMNFSYLHIRGLSIRIPVFFLLEHIKLVLFAAQAVTLPGVQFLILECRVQGQAGSKGNSDSLSWYNNF